MPGTRRAPGDVTGRSSAVLVEQHQKELAARAGEIAVINAIALEQSNEVIDVVIPQATPKAGVEQIEVDQPEETVQVTVAENIREMTWGAGNLQNFDAGHKYNMPRSMAEWLAERGYIWGM